MLTTSTNLKATKKNSSDNSISWGFSHYIIELQPLPPPPFARMMALSLFFFWIQGANLLEVQNMFSGSTSLLLQ